MARLSIELTKELHDRVGAIPWGIRRHIFMKLLDKACALFEERGERALGAILAEDFRLEFTNLDPARNSGASGKKKNG